MQEQDKLATTLIAGALTLFFGVSLAIVTFFQNGQQAIEENRILRYQNEQLLQRNRDLEAYQNGYERATNQLSR